MIAIIFLHLLCLDITYQSRLHCYNFRKSWFPVDRCKTSIVFNMIVLYIMYLHICISTFGLNKQVLYLRRLELKTFFQVNQLFSMGKTTFHSCPVFLVTFPIRKPMNHNDNNDWNRFSTEICRTMQSGSFLTPGCHT